MKKEKGITLMTLTIYVIVMIIVVVTMNLIATNFYNSENEIQEDTKEMIEFNKFNTFFLKEIKTENNAVSEISNNSILFNTGNSFRYSDGVIYYNNDMICNNVKKLKFQLGLDGNEVDRSIINVNIRFNNYRKTINYKIEKMY